MARIRTLKPECWQDEALGTVSRDARLLFVGLITQADDAGRVKGGLSLLRSLIFPYDSDLDLSAVETWLSDLATTGLVIRYERDGKPFIALRNWAAHQRINRPQPSRIPAPPRQKRSVNGHGMFLASSLPEGIKDQGEDQEQGEDRS